MIVCVCVRKLQMLAIAQVIHNVQYAGQYKAR